MFALVHRRSISKQNPVAIQERRTSFGDIPVQEIDTALVMKVLRRIWSTTTETASRVRGRIEAVLDAARAQGHIAQGRARGCADLTVHGFRSTFRDWAAERTHFPNHVVEQALAHAIGSAVEAAYRRGDLIEQRRPLMDQWDRFCSTSPAEAQVIPLNISRATIAP